MSFSYKNQQRIFVPGMIVGIAFLFISVSGGGIAFLLERIFLIVTGEGIAEGLFLPWLFTATLGILLILVFAYLMKKPLLTGDAQGLKIHKLFRTYHFAWDEIESLVYQQRKLTFFGRRGLLDRPFYEYLIIKSCANSTVKIEITYADGGTAAILDKLREYTSSIKTEMS